MKCLNKGDNAMPVKEWQLLTHIHTWYVLRLDNVRFLFKFIRASTNIFISVMRNEWKPKIGDLIHFK